jgi:DNA (cytosine-5)-methyltransferase 1
MVILRSSSWVPLGVPRRRLSSAAAAAAARLLPGDARGDPRDVLFVDDAGEPDVAENGEPIAFGFYWTEGTKGLGWAANAVPTLKGGSTVGVPSPPAVWLPSGEIVTVGLRDAERLQGFPADWALPAESVSRRSMRWKLVGNAVSVPVAKWLGRRLARPALPRTGHDAALPGRAGQCRLERGEGASRRS